MSTRWVGLMLLAIFTCPALCRAGARAETRPVNRRGTPATFLEKAAGVAGFSFVYDGKRSGEILPDWQQTKSSKSLAGGRTLEVTTFRDSATGLEVSREITSFSGVPALECILRLHNAGTEDTPMIEKLLPLDLRFLAGRQGKTVLHSVRGSLGKEQDYLPIDQELISGTELDLSHYQLEGASQVNGQLPFFNLQWTEGGVIGAVGWTGQWAVHVRGEKAGEVVLQAGQQITHFRLHPGESIRTPRILLLRWQGKDRWAAHNQFRKLLLAHYVPRIDGQVVEPPVGNSNAFAYMYQAIEKKTGRNPLAVVAQVKPGEEGDLLSLANDALNWVNENNQLDFIRGLPPFMELYWLDAGWFEGEWPFGVGSWNPDPKKFPHGLKPLGDAAHEKGMKFLLWFEPGRVGAGSVIATEHPQWVLHRPEEGKLGGLFNYGDPAALQWMLASLSQRIEEWGVDIYRQDSNICPLLFWRNADAPDRQGISEMRWIEGLYALWDGLLRQHPKLMIDNANWRVTGPDLEVMSRSVGSLTRSETECGGIPHPAATQVQSAELSLWVPISVGTVNGFDPYVFRSGATNGVGYGLDLRASYVPFEQSRQGVEELKSLRPFWLGDYYPLTDIGLDERAWAGWQFDRPDLKSGFAVFFRRPLSPQATLKTGLRGLDPAAGYDVTFSKTYEVAEKRRMSGQQLMDLRVGIDARPGSLLIRYQPAGLNQPGKNPAATGD